MQFDVQGDQARMQDVGDLVDLNATAPDVLERFFEAAEVADPRAAMEVVAQHKPLRSLAAFRHAAGLA